jgi:hypothetical protein
LDERHFIPKGSHFGDGSAFNLTWRDRCSVAPVNYYYVDCGLSASYPHGKKAAINIGVVDQVKSVPEQSDSIPYDLFQVDIYHLWYTILKVIEAGTYFIISAANIYSHALNCVNLPRSSNVCAWTIYGMSQPCRSVYCVCDASKFEYIISSIKRRKMNTRIWRDIDTLGERFIRFILGAPIL